MILNFYHIHEIFISLLLSCDGKILSGFDGSRILFPYFSASVIKIYFLHFKAFIAGGDIPQEQEAGKCGSSFYFCSQSAKRNH